MNTTTFGCSGMHGGEQGKPDFQLCAPLQQLKQEHIPLRIAMDAFHATAETLLIDPGTARNDSFAALYGQVADFTEQLKKHSRKEDDGLFPLMAKYIGSVVGPIAVMTYEHEQAEQNLQRFLDAAGERESGSENEDAATIVGYAVQAYSILTQHFNKEEQVLFPMAENILSPEDKDQLDSIVQEQ